MGILPWFFLFSYSCVSSMMFRTPVHITPSPQKINLKDPVLTVGSCFSDSIGALMEDHKFSILKNPVGNTYNPLSIFKILEMALTQSKPDQDRWVLSDGIWYHYDFHSQFSEPDKEAAEAAISIALESIRSCILQSPWIIITMGTAWVYKEKASSAIAANCHKQPGTLFEKQLLTSTQIIQAYEHVENIWKQHQIDPKVIFTVSPVRHTRDGIPENMLSKSILRVACTYLLKGRDHHAYFPSYEIMMDDLRDYRFYEKDLIHPNETAIEYIWEQFSKAYFDATTMEFIEKWQQIKKGLQHRPFHPGTPSHQKFLDHLEGQLLHLAQWVDLSPELKHLNDQRKKS